jgi:hypothetical protein
MGLSNAQKLILKGWLVANAAALNAQAAPDYWVWRESITRFDVHHQTGPDGTTWNWATYKTQGVAEQNAWTLMFMGDVGPVGLVNFRAGVLAIFSGTGAPLAQRTHVFAVGRRRATVAQKLLAVAVVSPPANTGNDTAQARGSAANPDNSGYDPPITAQDVIDSLNAS